MIDVMFFDQKTREGILKTKLPAIPAIADKISVANFPEDIVFERTQGSAWFRANSNLVGIFVKEIKPENG